MASNPKKHMAGHCIVDKDTGTIYKFHPIDYVSEHAYCAHCDVPNDTKLCRAYSTQSKCNAGKYGVFFYKERKE